MVIIGIEVKNQTEHPAIIKFDCISYSNSIQISIFVFFHLSPTHRKWWRRARGRPTGATWSRERRRWRIRRRSSSLRWSSGSPPRSCNHGNKKGYWNVYHCFYFNFIHYHGNYAGRTQIKVNPTRARFIIRSIAFYILYVVRNTYHVNVYICMSISLFWL